MFEAGHNLHWDLTPIEALAGWPLNRRVAMLCSGRLHQRWARYTILAEPVGSYRFVADLQEAIDLSDYPKGKSEWISSSNKCPFGDLAHHPINDLRQALKCQGGLWIGYLGYDIGRWLENDTSVGPMAIDDRNWPIIELGWCPGYLVYDNITGRWTAHGRYADHLDIQLQPRQFSDAYTIDTPKSVFTRDQYEAKVRRCLEYIAAGDVYQVNLAQRFTAGYEPHRPTASRQLFCDVLNQSPPWYGAYLELAEDQHGCQDSLPFQRAIASISPELFLEVDGQDVVSRPIKGTRPWSAGIEQLRDSVKDKAELNMIIDLVRNDLGRVSEYGSVHVTEARALESHPTIYHGVATIQSRLRESMDVIDLIQAAMPGGSITGAPKVRAMQIIEELESVYRGPYCGSIGYLSNQHSCLNIAIRTMLIDASKKRIDYSVGAGIVADSDPASEYQETLDKAAAMLNGIHACAATRPSSCLEQ